MSINKIYGNNNYYAANKASYKQEDSEGKKAEQKQEQQTEAATIQDGFVRQEQTASVTYSNKLSASQVEQLQAAEEQRVASFQKFIQSMVVKQGQQSNFNLFGLDLYVSEADSNAAAAAIAPGGEYSVEAVADRIMNMAYALSGGDASKIEELRSAVQKGFEAAGVKLGGELPSISQDTYTEIMNRFDKWAEEAGVTLSKEEE